MTSQAAARRHGRIFDGIADEYDRRRPAYPDALIDRACELAGLQAGSAVLEVGCGTGQLTRALVARGLRVTAVEPGPRLIARARDHLADAHEVRFVNARLEDASLPCDRFPAVFCASAIHWVDPDVGWRAIADTLVDGGVLALLSYLGLEDPHSAADQRALRAGIEGIAPDVAAGWPAYRELAATLAGARARRANVSEMWAWLGGHEIARTHAARLFCDTEIAMVPNLFEQTGSELNAVLATMSFWVRLSDSQRAALLAHNEALHQRLGRPIRASAAACLVTARRARRRQASRS